MLMIRAKLEDIDNIEKLYNDSIIMLNQKNIFQWDNKYPNRETCKYSIDNKEQFIFNDNGLLIGSVSLNESQAKEWNIVDWNYRNGKKLVIHALVIEASLQGKGYGNKVLKMCEEHARKNNYYTIRLDVFSENSRAIRLYEKNDYKKVGEVNFDFKPKGHQEYYCYEKKLN